MTLSLNFGYLPQNVSYGTRHFVAEPLPEFEEIVSNVSSHEQAGDRWVYPPLERRGTPSQPDEEKPLVPTIRFEMPSTHSLTVRDVGDERPFAEFGITLVGLLNGLRLLPEGWGHFYKVAIKPHSLSDLICSRREIEAVLDVATLFWEKNAGSPVRSLIFGAMHWLLFSQSYEHEFEEFGAQYTVMDTCFRAHCVLIGKAPGGTHADRPSQLATAYSLALLLQRYGS